jgi:hypothetical protein
MVALLRGYERAGTESTGALVGILALPLPPMGWIHTVGKFVVVYQFVYNIVHSTGVYGSSFLHLILIYVSVICKISPNRSLPRCPYIISPSRCTTNGISSLATEVVICILLLSMILFGHSCKLFVITNI